jgi:toxin CcdB
VLLTPVLELEGKKYLALTPQLSGISRKELGATITDASQFRPDIINAMHFLLTGV